MPWARSANDMVEQGHPAKAVTQRIPISRCWPRLWLLRRKARLVKALATASRRPQCDGPTFIEMTPPWSMAILRIFDVDGVRLELTRAEEDASLSV